MPVNEEFSRIAWLSRLFALGPEVKRISLGIGDDAAVLQPVRNPWVWTVDACVQGVHFDWNWLSSEDVGWRSLQAAVSDIAAMGAHPVAALSSIALPSNTEASLWRGLARGQARAAKALGCPVIGGNLTRASEVSIHTTVLGHVKKPILRSGARPADELWLVGKVGAAAAGLSVLRSVPVRNHDAAMRSCVQAWRRPKALVREGVSLNGRAHAAIDVSDGIAGDSSHISESSGVALVLEVSTLQQAASVQVKKVAKALGLSTLDWVLFGGEDYALLATGPARNRPDCARCIGHVESGQGVWLNSPAGKRQIREPGFDHFRAKQQTRGGFVNKR
jgi:thiamine-monophosphate kinase